MCTEHYLFPFFKSCRLCFTYLPGNCKIFQWLQKERFILFPLKLVYRLIQMSFRKLLEQWSLLVLLYTATSKPKLWKHRLAMQFLMADYISLLLTISIAFLPFTMLPQMLERGQAVIAELRGKFFLWILGSEVAQHSKRNLHSLFFAEEERETILLISDPYVTWSNN